MMRRVDGRGRGRQFPAVAGFLVGVVAVVLAAGCHPSGSEPDPDRVAKEWAADYAAARAAATTDFEREVLADDNISEAEYDEAVNRYVTCLQQTMPPQFAGVAVQWDRFGRYSIKSPELTPEVGDAYDQALDQADAKCRVGTIAVIAGLYEEKLTNPDRLTPEQQIVACLKRYGLVDKSYTVDNFEADSRIDGADPKKATGLDLGSGQANQCRVTPWA